MTSDPPRLAGEHLDRLRRGDRVRVASLRERPRVGIVHLGIGAFHRAHQAVFTEDAMAAAEDLRWGIFGVTQRSRAVVDQLAPQDGLYGVLQQDAGDLRLRIVRSVRQVHYVGDGPHVVVDRIADPDVSVLTITVSEKGYRRAVDGGLALDDPLVRADLAGAPPRTVVGQIVRGLQRRAGRHGAGITVLSCDNLTRNGSALSRLVDDFCAALPTGEGDALHSWITANVRFPSSMVDRIVPATSPRDFAAAEALTGVHDAGLVVAEPCNQWVIQDMFAGPRPAWERAGAELVDDVEPYETAKLRLLNATHSLLAYAGVLAGHATIADAVADPALTEAADRYMVEDATPTLCLPPEFDVAQYRASVLHRFANPALRHTTTQVAMDGSQKLPVRLLGVVRDRLAAGSEPQWAALAVAAWMLFVARSRDDARFQPLNDPIAGRLQEAAAGPTAGLVRRMLDVREVFDEDLAGSAVFAELLAEHVRRLDRVSSTPQ
ncbi:MAG: mannitol dehydrogenase family protein [Actinomadura sp.]